MPLFQMVLFETITDVNLASSDVTLIKVTPIWRFSRRL